MGLGAQRPPPALPAPSPDGRDPLRIWHRVLLEHVTSVSLVVYETSCQILLPKLLPTGFLPLTVRLRQKSAVTMAL